MGKHTQPSPRLLPYQVAWIADDARLVIAEKSRRIGLTWATALGVVRDRLSGSVGRDCLYLAHREQAAREFMETAIGFARDLYGRALELLTGFEVFDRDDLKVMRIDFPDMGRGPSKLLAMTSNPHALRGFGGDLVIDEFAFHRDPTELLKAAMPVTQWGGRVRILSTHHGRANAFCRLIERTRRHLDPALYGEPGPHDPKASLHKITILDAVEQGLVERINAVAGFGPVSGGAVSGGGQTREAFLASCRQQAGTELAWAEEYLCEPSVDGGSYMPLVMLEACVDPSTPAPVGSIEDLITTIKARRAAIKHTGVVYLGVDIGRYEDRFVIWCLARRGERVRTLGALVYQGASFAMMEDAIETVMRIMPVGRCCIDATGLGMQLAERIADRHGRLVERVTITAPSKVELITGLREQVERRAIDLPDDPVTLDDLASIKRTVSDKGRVSYSADRGEDGHADRAIACALAVKATKSGGDFEMRSAPPSMVGVLT